jgi:hypothetical protein
MQSERCALPISAREVFKKCKTEMKPPYMQLATMNSPRKLKEKSVVQAIGTIVCPKFG